jgi:hypothetical protein
VGFIKSTSTPRLTRFVINRLADYFIPLMLDNRCAADGEAAASVFFSSPGSLEAGPGFAHKRAQVGESHPRPGEQVEKILKVARCTRLARLLFPVLTAFQNDIQFLRYSE